MRLKNLKLFVTFGDSIASFIVLIIQLRKDKMAGRAAANAIDKINSSLGLPRVRVWFILLVGFFYKENPR